MVEGYTQCIFFSPRLLGENSSHTLRTEQDCTLTEQTLPFWRSQTCYEFKSVNEAYPKGKGSCAMLSIEFGTQQHSENAISASILLMLEYNLGLGSSFWVNNHKFSPLLVGSQSLFLK